MPFQNGKKEFGLEYGRIASRDRARARDVINEHGNEIGHHWDKEHGKHGHCHVDAEP